MMPYVLRRLGGLAVSLAVLSVVVFTLMHTVPGGPFSYEQNMPKYMMDNIAAKSGSTGTNVGAICHRFAHITRVSATDVLELVSSASVFTSAIGTRA